MHWPEIQRLAHENTDKSDQRLGLYFLEAQRLTSEQVDKRTAKASIKVGEETLAPDRDIMLSIVSLIPP